MPIIIKKKLENRTVQEDEEVTLEVEIRKPSLEVTWKKDHVALQPGGNMEVHVEGTKHSLSFKKISSTDQGHYSCETMDDKTRAKITVENLEHVFSRGLRDTRAEEKGVAVLECETRRPSLRTTWLKGVAVLKPGGKYHMRQQERVLSLTINHLEKSDGDVYTCDVGTARSSAALTIQEQTKESRKAGCLEQCHKMLSSHQSETEDSTLGVNPIPTQGLITSTFYSRSRERSVHTHIPLVPVDLPVVANPGSDRSHQTYSFLSEINRGRFSVVWQCQDDWSKQLFAAKFTPYAQEQQQRALGEYQLLKKLSHIHIVQLRSAFITPCYLVLIQELCAGRELLHNLAERDLYAEVHVSELLQQILSAVEYLHHRLIVHLDLKSENMLVTDHNLLKIVDLSSAQTFTPGQTLPVDHIQEMKAPEVLEKQGVGPETDIWAIGVLVFIMLSGDDPFQSELHWESRSNIKKGRIQFSRCYPGLSEGSVSFIKRTLNHKTWGRPSAAECLQLPWVKGWHGSSRHSDSIVCFSTDKLQAYLQEQETKREKVRTKMDMPLSN
ncbi:obscurin-like [Conger conger]|uniref:obscurin-like n=1 Tax=Conger conger TaxID=82655 RepID=UPI002A5AAB88|nr:obscurin-like [Conger conger]